MKYIFIDGSTINNGKVNASGGIGVVFYDLPIYPISKVYLVEIPTNQKCELYALKEALETVLSNYITKRINDTEYMIVSDSTYVINVFTKWIWGWKTKEWKTKENTEIKNIELIKAIDNILNACYKMNINIQFQHIRSHKTEPKDKSSLNYLLWKGNYDADILAKKQSIGVRDFLFTPTGVKKTL